jgi:membrane fusion protein (multidrug efflux system)
MARYTSILVATLAVALLPGLAGAQQAPAPVISKKVIRISMPTQAESLGTTRANESLDVTSKVSERVREIHFEEGQLVKAGQVLVKLDTDEASANLAVASADLSESRSNFERAAELDRTQSISRSELKQLESKMNADKARVEAARARLEDLTITAAFAGRVGLRRVSAGSLVSPGTLITTLDDLSTIKLDFSLPEALLAEIRPGQDISATSIAYPGRSFHGIIASVDTRVDPVTRSVMVRALVPNSDTLLRPGMLLSVVVTQQATSALVIPEQSIVSEQSRQYVYVVKADTVQKREVRTGRRLPGVVEVLQGLMENEIIVVEGTQRLHDGVSVKVQRELTAEETSS